MPLCTLRGLEGAEHPTFWPKEVMMVSGAKDLSTFTFAHLVPPDKPRSNFVSVSVRVTPGVAWVKV